MGALYQGDCLEDDFDPWLEETDSWIDRVYQLNGDVDAPPDAVISHFLTDDELYQTLAFPPDYDWSTTVIFKFDVDCAEIWPKLCQFVDLCPEVKFGGWARTKVAYVHLIKTWTVDEADFLIGKREVDIEGVHCRILPVRIYPC
ncbi:uncharacterized protein LOC144157854 [Haemaphysalis longicornis]|uniref:Uncharacterized protein n=1 Tax=Haemaphysalis longicornis TaxID=44386 RepID=A0A9J6FPP5_HAELO|nr:hypothetical protein HPB48_015650 [Haemaphysalis longicornis]KAH9364020.1 hypothetical protein HPB48_015353 [Haemaphysalis longicornis]